jgi:two-component system, chemotaxis family, CheB/CheR fusion protein
MAKKTKSGAGAKDRQKKASSKAKVHPEQKAAEHEEKKALKKHEKVAPHTEVEVADAESREEHASVGEPKEEFPIIGIGASAGGLEALEGFLSHVPEECGMAFVVISHTDPERASLLPDILKRKSKVGVSVIEEGIFPEPERVYLPPSDKDVTIKDRIFHLEARERIAGLHMPIDRFLKSLAEDRGEWAGCVILSGTGSDGTQGLSMIKANAGVAFSQSTDSARHSGMPRSAIDTGLVDFVLPAQEMPEQLIRYFKRPGRILRKDKAEEPKELQRILSFLASRANQDFSLYKKSTLIRRIERRMSITGSRDGSEYLHHLHRDSKEAEALIEDLLIGVTNFFRDPAAFAYLKEEILPELIGRNRQKQALRIWIPGCSTGEEAYSVAMVVREALEEANTNLQMQIFATDVDRKAVEKARQGIYIENIASDVSPDRLKRFFSKDDHHYRIRKEIREPIVYAVQNVLSDPPFSNLDLLVCRNLLIYLEAEAQRKLIPLFHYTLRNGGVLFLGASESIGRFVELFETINKKFSMYRKREAKAGPRPAVQFPTKTPRLESARSENKTKAQADRGEGLGVAQATERMLLKKHTPACVVVDRDGNILYIHGRIGKYIEQPEGKPSLQIVDMAREGIRFALVSILRKAASSGEEVRHERLRVSTNGGYQELNLVVKPFSEPPALNDKYMVLFEDLKSVPEKEIKKSKRSADDQNGRIGELEQELARVRQQYQGSMEELESSNEELRSLNEEMQSSNEELQSSNEELESSREELQSLNEELGTVNSELHGKIEELAEAYGTITNVLDSTQIAVLFLDNEFQVKRFTREASRLINLIGSDVGRPIEHISHHLDYGDFTNRLRRVLETLAPFEDDVRTKDGHWYRMRIMVYRTAENVIEGAVVTFVNIDAQKQAQAEIEEMSQRELQAERRFCRSIVDTVRESLLVLDKDYRIVSANRSFYETFKLAAEETEGRTLFKLGEGQWDIPELRRLLDRISAEGKPFDDYRMDHTFKAIGLKRMALNARVLRDEEEERTKILLAIENVTERRECGEFSDE